MRPDQKFQLQFTHSLSRNAFELVRYHTHGGWQCVLQVISRFVTVPKPKDRAGHKLQPSQPT